VRDDPRSQRPGDGGGHPSCFLHVPKCAGMSMRAALHMALPPGSLAPQGCDGSVFCDFTDFELLGNDARTFVVATDAEALALADYRAVAGHFWLATLLQVAPPSSVATILREPRARLLSLYAYWRITPGVSEALQPYDVFRHALRPLDEFISEPRIAGMVDNQVCRMLLRGDPRMPVDEFIAPGDVDAIASDAINQLSALGFVGIIERPEGARQGLARLFGVELADVRGNVTGELGRAVAPPGQRLITSETLELLERRTAADAIVYQHFLGGTGLSREDARRLTETAFATQLVRLGEATGSSAMQLNGSARDEGASHGLDDPQAVRSQTEELRSRLAERERELKGLGEQVRRERDALERTHSTLESVQRSASWRLTAPLRRAKRLITGANKPLL
jgi:hypothetical protein